jgi:prophage antirepressor-like protein
MSSLAVFAFENQDIRFVNGQPVANDVAIALGYAKPADAVYRLVKPKYKGVCKIQTPGGRQSVTVLKEAGIYALAMSSKLPSAEKFQDWVFETVLPEIRKTGGFNLSADQRRVDTRDTLAKKTRKSLTDQIKVYLEDMGLYDDPDAWEHFASAHDRINTLLTTETAKKMRRRIEASTGVKVKESDLIRDWYPQVRLIDYIVLTRTAAGLMALAKRSGNPIRPEEAIEQGYTVTFGFEGYKPTPIDFTEPIKEVRERIAASQGRKSLK